MTQDTILTVNASTTPSQAQHHIVARIEKRGGCTFDEISGSMRFDRASYRGKAAAAVAALSRAGVIYKEDGTHWRLTSELEGKKR